MTKEEVEGIVEAFLATKKLQQLNPWKDWRFLVGIPSALLVTGTIWIALGFPTPATSADVKRLERGSAEIAVQVYQNAINNLIANTPPKEAPIAQQRAWQQQLDQTNRALERSIEKKIELSK